MAVTNDTTEPSTCQHLDGYLLYRATIHPNLFAISFCDPAIGNTFFRYGHGADYVLEWQLISPILNLDNRARLGFDCSKDEQILAFIAAKRSISVGELYTYVNQQIVQPEPPQAATGTCIDLAAIAGSDDIAYLSAKAGAPWIRQCQISDDEELSEHQIYQLRDHLDGQVSAMLAMLPSLLPGIEARRALAARYGLSADALLDKRDSQLAEAIIIDHICKSQNTTACKIKARRDRLNHDSIPYCAIIDHDRIAAMHPGPAVSALLESFNDRAISKTAGKYRHDPSVPRSIEIAGKTYRLGLGGIHSKDDPGIIEPDPGHHILDIDASSFYPNLIIGLSAAPAHIGQDAISIYAQMLKDRLKAKAAGDTATDRALKLAINSLYGNLNYHSSLLYDPASAYKVTINGQLYLLLLIERLEAAGIEVISANTDGVTVHCRDKTEAKQIAAAWRDDICRDRPDMSMSLDAIEYRAIIRRSTNDYAAIGKSGEVLKGKGIFAQHSSRHPIVGKAIIDHIVDGIPFADSIKASNNALDFAIISRSASGHLIDDGSAIDDYQSTARWYLKQESGLSIYRNDNGRPGKLKHGDGIGLLGDISAFDRHDLDDERYVQICQEILSAIVPAANDDMADDEPADRKPSTNNRKAQANAAPEGPLSAIHEKILGYCNLLKIEYQYSSSAEMEIDLNGTGHFTYKVNHQSGQWFSTGSDGQPADKGGNILRHLDDLFPGIGDQIESANDCQVIDDEYIADCEQLEESADEPIDDEPTQPDDARITTARRFYIWFAKEYPYANPDWQKLVIDYLSSRNLKPWNEFEDIVRLAPPSADDTAAGAITTMVLPMLATDGEHIGDIVGVNRTFITADARKLERRFLGHVGITPLNVSSDNRLIFIGEGLETTLSALAIPGSSGFVCHNAGNLEKTARNFIQAYEQIIGNPLPDDAIIVVLVDNDASKAGQIASWTAVQELRALGLKAQFAMPDRRLVPDAPAKGVDWNNVLVAHGQSMTADLIQIAAATGDKTARREIPDNRAERVRDATEAHEASTGSDLEAIRSRLDGSITALSLDYIGD